MGYWEVLYKENEEDSRVIHVVYRHDFARVRCLVTVVTDTCGSARSIPFADDILIK